VTLWYRAPEVLLGEIQFDCGIDTWALGAVFMHIVCMRALIRCSTIPEQLYKTIEFAGSPHHPDCRWTRGKQLADAVEMRDPMALPPYPYCGKREVPRVPSGFWQCLDVIHKMMALDPHDRPSCAVACQMMVAIADGRTKNGAAEVK
jgi:serine/threonine protein kinase